MRKMAYSLPTLGALMAGLASPMLHAFRDTGWTAPRRFNVDRGGATLPSPLTRQLRRQQERLQRKGRSL